MSSLLTSSSSMFRPASSSLLYLFIVSFGLTDLLKYSLASLSFSSSGRRPIHLEMSLPLSVSFNEMRPFKLEESTQIIRSKSDSFPIASLIVLFVSRLPVPLSFSTSSSSSRLTYSPFTSLKYSTLLVTLLRSVRFFNSGRDKTLLIT